MLFTRQEKRGVQYKLKDSVTSDTAGDRDQRISITGFAIYLSGYLVAWTLKSQKMGYT
jgi:hypothetical protein